MPERDATLRIQLQVDTMVQRLIAEQSQRLEERAVATVGKAFSIGRDQLLQQREGTLSETLGEIMRYAPYSLSSPTRCVFIDEKLATAEVVFMLFPEEIQRVEFLFNGGMMRIYTRRFMASMVGAPVKLERPSFSAVTRPHGTGRTSECFLLVTLCLDAAGIMSMAGRRCNPQLLRIVQSLATDRNEVIARGVTESDLIAKTQKIAADGLAGVLPLPRREHRDPNIPGGAT
ncbi:MAG: hypothetical protein ACRENP_09800 [Longimicrobiales bacterium]